VIRFLISVLFKLLANTIGLVVAAAVLEDMSITGTAFVIAVGIFTVVEVVLQPLVTKIALQHASALMGGTALVTTFVGLVITEQLNEGLEISGATTWVLATLIVWLAALLAGILLPAVLFKKTLAARQG